jgi:hypothetical protein
MTEIVININNLNNWTCYICLDDYNTNIIPLIYCDRCKDGKICYNCVKNNYNYIDFKKCNICKKIFVNENKNESENKSLLGNRYMNFINRNSNTIDFKSKIKYTFMIHIILFGIDIIVFSIYIDKCNIISTLLIYNLLLFFCNIGYFIIGNSFFNIRKLILIKFIQKIIYYALIISYVYLLNDSKNCTVVNNYKLFLLLILTESISTLFIPIICKFIRY